MIYVINIGSGICYLDKFNEETDSIKYILYIFNYIYFLNMDNVYNFYQKQVMV